MNRKIIGYVLICLGVLVFYPFSEMTIRVFLGNPDFLMNLFATLHVFFFTNWLVLHIPGFVLIGIGIYLLIKNSRNKSIKITE